MGSLSAAYEQPEDDEPAGENELAAEVPDDWEEREERLPAMRPRSRPPEFNKLLRALVREMAALHNNWRVAYAIDRTQMFFTDAELRGDRSASNEAFRDALAEFGRMSLDEQIRWQERVFHRHPRLDRIASDDCS